MADAAEPVEVRPETEAAQPEPPLMENPEPAEPTPEEPTPEQAAEAAAGEEVYEAADGGRRVGFRAAGPHARDAEHVAGVPAAGRPTR